MVFADFLHFFVISFVDDIINGMKGFFVRRILLNIFLCGKRLTREEVGRFVVEAGGSFAFDVFFSVSGLKICDRKGCDSGMELFLGKRITVEDEFGVKKDDFVAERVIGGLVGFGRFRGFFGFTEDVFFELVDKVDKFHEFFIEKVDDSVGNFDFHKRRSFVSFLE